MRERGLLTSKDRGCVLACMSQEIVERNEGVKISFQS